MPNKEIIKDQPCQAQIIVQHKPSESCSADIAILLVVHQHIISLIRAISRHKWSQMNKEPVNVFLWKTKQNEKTEWRASTSYQVIKARTEIINRKKKKRWRTRKTFCSRWSVPASGANGREVIHLCCTADGSAVSWMCAAWQKSAALARWAIEKSGRKTLCKLHTHTHTDTPLPRIRRVTRRVCSINFFARKYTRLLAHYLCCIEHIKGCSYSMLSFSLSLALLLPLYSLRYSHWRADFNVENIWLMTSIFVFVFF